MRPLTETRDRAPARDQRDDPAAEREGQLRSDTILVVSTVATVVLTAVLVVLTALTVHNRVATAVVAIAAIVVCGAALVWLVMRAVDHDRRTQRKTTDLARKIEDGRSGVAVLLRGKGSTKSLKELKRFLEKTERLSVVRLGWGVAPEAERLLDDLKKLLEKNSRLSVVRLDSSLILQELPGTPEDAFRHSLECLKFVSKISSGIEGAPGLSAEEKGIAKELRGVISSCLQQSDPLDTLRNYTARKVRAYKLTNKLVLLAEATPETLTDPAGKWLLDLLKKLGCHFGVFTQEAQPDQPDQYITVPEGQRYVADTLILPLSLSKQAAEDVFSSLRDAVSRPLGLDLDLLTIRCAVLAAAAGLGKQVQAEAIERLPPPGSPPEDLAEAAALEVGWLVERRAARDGVLDRLAVVDEVTPEMFAVLLRDLGLDVEGTRELFDWMRGDELGLAGIIVSSEDTISLGASVRSVILKWLGEDEQSAANQKAKIAAERCYRECLILDPAHVPGPGYADWMREGYAGLALFENLDWRMQLQAWRDRVAEIESSADRRDARVAITCLFLETWWWWGDQLRLPFVNEVLNLAREILRDQPGWINALDEFNDNYVPEFDKRARAGDKWRHVVNALDFLAGCEELDLRQGSVPSDRVLARIYVCWCFFNGDAAQYTGELEAADEWFRQAAEACGDDEDGAAKRAFASYQQADVWIPSDTDRSMRVIMDTSLADAADRLEDQSLRAYVARMYGDIRWKSGNADGAFAAYGRALLLSYIYQVDQEYAKMPPNEYTYGHYDEMRTRFLRRLDEAPEKGLGSAADAATERIRELFGPYWALTKTATASPEDRLAGIVPPLPDHKDLDLGSGYVRHALMLKDMLREQVAEPIISTVASGWDG